MARHRTASLGLSAEQARQALTVLVQEGKLAPGQVQKALERHRHLVTDLRARLAALEEGVGQAGRRLFKDGTFPMMARRAEAAGRRVVKRAKPRISAATRKMYQQQGQYMAALRNLSKAARKKIKAIRQKSGVKAAIAAAKRMAK